MSTAFVLAPFQLLRSATPDPVYLVMFGASAVLGVAHSVLIPMSMQFVFNGADIMCPGLTSAGATIEDEADEGAVVAIYAEGKEHALAVGLTTMSTEDIRTKNKGPSVSMTHPATTCSPRGPLRTR